jgi:hypothetical protein
MQTAMCIKGSGETTKLMVEASINIQMEVDMMESGERTSNMATEWKVGQTEQCTKDSI